MTESGRRSFSPLLQISYFNNDAANFHSVDVRVWSVSRHFVRYVHRVKTHACSKGGTGRRWKTNIIRQVCGTFGSDSVIPSGSKRVVARRGGVGGEGRQKKRERERERAREIDRERELRQSHCSSMWKGDIRKVWKGSPEGGGYWREGWRARRDGKEEQRC